MQQLNYLTQQLYRLTLTRILRATLLAFFIVALIPKPVHSLDIYPESPKPKTYQIMPPLSHIEAFQTVSTLQLVYIPPPPCQTGITAPDYYENLVMQRESGGKECAINYIGCEGLFQACPGAKLEAACPDWQDNIACQENFFTGYMLASYGSWANAWASEVDRGWW